MKLACCKQLICVGVGVGVSVCICISIRVCLDLVRLIRLLLARYHQRHNCERPVEGSEGEIVCFQVDEFRVARLLLLAVGLFARLSGLSC